MELLSPLFCWVGLPSFFSFRSWCFPPCALCADFFGAPAPPKRGRGRQHDTKEEEAEESRTTEREEEGPPLNLTSVYLTNLNFSFCFVILLFFKRERHHPTGKRRKTAPPNGGQGKNTFTLRRRSEAAPPNRRGELLLVVLPSSAFFGWRGRFPFYFEIKDIKMNCLHLPCVTVVRSSSIGGSPPPSPFGGGSSLSLRRSPRVMGWVLGIVVREVFDFVKASSFFRFWSEFFVFGLNCFVFTCEILVHNLCF